MGKICRLCPLSRSDPLLVLWQNFIHNILKNGCKFPLNVILANFRNEPGIKQSQWAKEDAMAFCGDAFKAAPVFDPHLDDGEHGGQGSQSGCEWNKHGVGHVDGGQE